MLLNCWLIHRISKSSQNQVGFHEGKRWTIFMQTAAMFMISFARLRKVGLSSWMYAHCISEATRYDFGRFNLIAKILACCFIIPCNISERKNSRWRVTRWFRIQLECFKTWFVYWLCIFYSNQTRWNILEWSLFETSTTIMFLNYSYIFFSLDRNSTPDRSIWSFNYFNRVPFPY